MYSYVPVFYDWPEVTDTLSAQEKGRLIDAIVIYARGGSDWQDLLKGNEKFVFPTFREQINRVRQEQGVRAETSRANGQKGGRPRKAKPQDGNPENPVGFLGFEKTYNNNNNEYKDNNNNYNKDNNRGGSGNSDYTRKAAAATEPAFDSPDFKADLNNPITFAVNELGRLSPPDMEELNSFRNDLPDDVIIYGINAACSARVRTWRYARSILNRYVSAGYKSVGEVKEAEAKREAAKASSVSDGNGGRVQNPALNYAQREYTEDDDPFSWMQLVEGGNA